MRSAYFARALPRLKALGCALAFLLLCGAPVIGPVHAQSKSVAAAGEQLRALIAQAGLGDKVGATVIDLSSGKTLLSHQGALPLNPASNMKVLTAAAAMSELGPDFRVRTGLYGRAQGEAGGFVLCLKGQADPTLVSADLLGFAERASQLGVRQVDEVIVDGTYFDAQVLPPAFEQQPGEMAPFRAAIAAVSLNANAYTLRVRPAERDGDKAHVSVNGSGYFEIDNQLLTVAGAAPNVIADQRPSGESLSLRLRGTLPLGGSSLAYERRVESPLHYAGHVLVDALRTLRIQAPKRVTVGPCPTGAPLLMSRTSPPLSEVLARLGKASDNFVAEMVLKTLGAERKRKPGRSADGAQVVREFMQRHGIDLGGLEIVNGSGLFKGNLVTTDQLASVLAAMYRDPSVRDDFVAHLAVGGVDGTLVRRFTNLPRPRIVRAKTGTLNDVIALSGYVLGPGPADVVVFSFIANAVAGKHAQSRELFDRMVTLLASALHAPVKN